LPRFSAKIDLLQGAAMGRKFSVVLPLALSLLGMSVLAQQANTPRRPVVGRSVVATRYGIVSASQPLAARAGVQVLERGGNAVDAAIATNAVMGVVEPAMNGLGGDLFVIYYDAKTGTLHGLNSGGWAPTGLTPAFLKSKGIEPGPGSRTVCRQHRRLRHEHPGSARGREIHEGILPGLRRQY
jgi:hypothetical protein